MLRKSISPCILCVFRVLGWDGVLPVSMLVHSLCCFLAHICLFPMLLWGEVGRFDASHDKGPTWVNGCQTVYPPPRFMVRLPPLLRSSIFHQLFWACVCVGIRLSTVAMAMWQPWILEKIGEVRRSKNCYTHTHNINHCTCYQTNRQKSCFTHATMTGNKPVSECTCIRFTLFYTIGNLWTTAACLKVID